LAWTVIVVLLAVVLGCVGIAVYVGWSLTHPDRQKLSDSPDKLGIHYHQVEFQSRTKDVTLKGWFLTGTEPLTGMTIIIAHGYNTNRLQMSAQGIKLAKSLVERGYNVLMFDFRNSGESGGSLTSVGYFEKHDLLGAVDWVKARQSGDKIGIIGFSMGAVVALIAAAEDPSVAGVVADSPFGNLKAYLEENLPVWSNLPNFPFTPLILNIMPRLTGIDPNGVDALSAVDNVYPRPVLFIHSVNDRSIPVTNSEAMYNKHPDRFELWKTDNEGHAKSHAADPQTYEEKVIDFFGKLK
jgi:fermentation-respiration switch protein FrsA (DUF1100 family)